MKRNLFVFFTLIYFSSFSQITIKGTVYDKNGPLKDVAVYFNNTMYGTTTNDKGEFSIETKEGQHELVVSFLGYKNIKYSLNTLTYKKPLVFALIESDEKLNEVLIKKTVFDQNWKYNLNLFKQEFLGRTALAKECKILNPKVLYFDYDASKNKLSAFAKVPLQIKNNGLGYLIIYELEHFERTKTHTTYAGYARYQELKGNKRKQKRWKENRLKAYNGSSVHFLRSVLNSTFTKEGFIVHQFKRVPNPERPTEGEITKARKLISASKISFVFNKKNDTPKNTIDSAFVILRKSKLPKYRDYLYKSKIKKSDFFSLKSNIPYLDFKDNLMVVYTKEKEEQSYLLKSILSKPRKPEFQTSYLIPNKRPSVILKSGILINELDVFYEGYWSYEKFAHSLPLDYQPSEN